MSPEEIKILTDTVKILSDMLESRTNEWLPLYAALGGAIAGALAGFVPTLFMEKRRKSLISSQLESGLLAEIFALVEIIEHREYLLGLKKIITELQSQPKGTKRSFTVKVPLHYCRVYQENCKNIGLIRTEIAHKVVIFYQLVDAVVQDIQPGGLVSNGSTLDSFQETEFILERAIEVSRELMHLKS